MALKATIYKAELHVADMERHYYQSHALTIARHPSENDERMMIRVLAFALHADELLVFTRGISTSDEPDLWIKSLSGEINSWIDLGQPDEKRVRQACGKAKHVWIYNYGGRPAEQWWQQNKGFLSRFDNLTVVNIPVEATKKLGLLARKAMSLQCSIQENQVFLVDGDQSVHVELEKRQ